MRQRHRADGAEKSGRKWFFAQRNDAAEDDLQHAAGYQYRNRGCAPVKRNSQTPAAEVQRREKGLERADDNRRCSSVKQQHEKDERIGNGNLGAETWQRDRDPRREEQGNRNQEEEAGIELAEVDLCSRIEKG